MKDLTKIDGVDVIERLKARMSADDTAIGIIPGVQAGQTMKTVDQVLLADERIVYQCVHHADPNCVYFATSIRSVTAHQRTHGGKAVAKRMGTQVAEAEAKAAQLEAELNERRQRRSDGGKRAAETRARNRVAPPIEVGGGRNTALGDKDLAKIAQNVITAFNAMQTCADEFQKVLISYMRAVQVASEAPAIDPQILAKAQQYDILKAAMNGLNDLK